MDDVVSEFLIESHALLDDLDQRLEQLATDSVDASHLAAIFRGLHTIKGSCGFLGFVRLEQLTHAGESLFARVRDGEVPVDAAITTVLEQLSETIRHALALIEAHGNDDELDAEALVAELARLREAEPTPAPAKGKRTTKTPKPGSKQRASAKSKRAARATEATAPAGATPKEAGRATTAHCASEAADEAGEAVPATTLEAASIEIPPDARPLGEILVSRGLCKPEQIVLAVSEQRKGDPRRLGEILVERGYCKPSDIKAALESQGEQHQSSLTEGTIRVDVGQLDKLMNLVGELVLARNQVQQYTSKSADIELVRASARLNLITTELQEGVMQTRMQPIRNVWNRFPRMVRHLATVCDKKVRVEMDGEDTELDKTILEAIKDPLTHFVRNVVDHGIESPDERQKAGKPPEGLLMLRAFHEGGQVKIEVSDDGRGIDLERVRLKALDRGLINSVQAARLSDREVANLVFEPGFSTAENVTNVSGRGVGMDVVKTNIERIGGSLDLLTERHKGTTLKVKIPLTLAIIPALLVSGGDGCYALPQISLVELVRLEGEAARTRIERVHGAPVYRLRGKLLPIVYLSQVLGEPPSIRLHDDELLNIVVLQADDRQFGLVVDEVRDTAEIVVKPVGKAIKSVPVFAGATILGDGSVALILDVLGLAQHAGVIAEVRDRSAKEQGGVVESGEQIERHLVFRLGASRRFALSLRQIDRLEEIPRDRIEYASGGDVVQYRGTILPLVWLRRHLEVDGPSGTTDATEQSTLNVLVYNDGVRRVGLVVDEIIDIVDGNLDLQPGGDVPCIRGTAVADGRVTDVIDAAVLLERQGLSSPPSVSKQERLSA